MSSSPDRRRPRSVLIVEDDRAGRLAIARILKRRGFAVSEAGTVAGAMAGLVRQPEWILLDLMLPDGCGINVIRRVQTQRLGSRVCVITGCCSDLLGEARRAGAQHAFIKPLDVERLINLLDD